VKVLDLAYHRNGICGEGFNVGIVEQEGRRMVVVRFSPEDDARVGAVLCAALDIDLLAQNEIRFGINSWRGDHFADAMDEAIAKATAIDGDELIAERTARQ